jgi:magnesium chelatase subunit D
MSQPSLTRMPIGGLVALDVPRLALMMLAVDPALRGVALAAPAGSGKSALLHGMRELQPDLPWVELPLGCDSEALLGGLDLEATLQQGRRVIRSGALARAHGGFLLAESCNLMDDGSANTLLGALEDGVVRIEREGLSLRSPAEFRLLTSFDPSEGAPRAHLLDRLGMIVMMPTIRAGEARASIVRRHLQPDAETWSDEAQLLRGLIESAREQLPRIKLGDAQRRELIRTADALGVQGHRADLFAIRVARASAALGLRDEVQREDLELAARLVLLPRATRQPEQSASAPPPESPTPESTPPPEARDEMDSDSKPLPSEEELELAEEVLESLAVELPDALASLSFARQRSGRSGSRGATSGQRGRHVSSVPGLPRGQRLDVIATLRAAARWQRVRTRRRQGIALTSDDFRIKKYRSKAGALFIFAVDASGSMALNRMRQAKGAVHALLEQAYVNRDRVALLAFRGHEADLLLPPTGSVELLRRAVDQLPTGGGTPLAASLVASLEVAEQSKRRGFGNIVLVLLTDGRANVGLKADRSGVDTEVKQLAHAVAATGIRSLVIDTQRSFLSQGNATQLARALAGDYLYLPNAQGTAIAAAARQVASA